jgi:hypothetical protein
VKIAREDGYGVDPAGIRRKLFAGQPISPNIETDVAYTDDEVGHFDPVAQQGIESQAAQDNRDYVEREQTYRPDIEGSRDPKEIEENPPDVSVGGFVGQSVNDLVGDHVNGEDASDLKGEALRARAQELEIEGRSGMSADELRAAIAAKEAPEVGGEGGPTTDEGMTSEDVTP